MAQKKKATASVKHEVATLKKENLTMVLLHPTMGELDFVKTDPKILLELSKTKGYEHLFEIKNKK